jgi:hypothetical protein
MGNRSVTPVPGATTREVEWRRRILQRLPVVSTLTGAAPVSKSRRNRRMQVAATSSKVNSARQMSTTLFPVRNGPAQSAEKNAA